MLIRDLLFLSSVSIGRLPEEAEDSLLSPTHAIAELSK